MESLKSNDIFFILLSLTESFEMFSAYSGQHKLRRHKPYVWFRRWPLDILNWCGVRGVRTLIHIPGSSGLWLPQMNVMPRVTCSQTSCRQQQRHTHQHTLTVNSLCIEVETMSKVIWQNAQLTHICIQQVSTKLTVWTQFVIACFGWEFTPKSYLPRPTKPRIPI